MLLPRTVRHQHPHGGQHSSAHTRRLIVAVLISLTLISSLYTIHKAWNVDRLSVAVEPMQQQATWRSWSDPNANSVESHQYAQGLPAVFRPGEVWRDADGNVIQAHGGGILYHEGVFYWYGEHKGGRTYSTPLSSLARVDVIGISCYSSHDLVTWRYEGLALEGGSHPDLAPNAVLERPKVLWNAATGRFVMWAHVDSADYETARVGVATAQRPAGPFSYRGSFRPHGQQSRDLTIFQDEDGSGHIVYSSEDNRVLHVGPLTRDFLGVTPRYKRILVGRRREAPALFKHGPWYFLLTSGCTGWEPNAAEVFFARSLMGEWRSLGNPCRGGSERERQFTFFAQATYVLPLPGRPGQFLFMADQWDPEDLANSRYIWLPMWAFDLPALELQHRAGGQAGGAAADAMDAGPLQVDVVVQWFDTWSLADLEFSMPHSPSAAGARAGTAHS